MKLIADKLAVARGEDLILSALSFDVSKGEALIVSGANGAGKSTLLRALAGLLPLEAGSLDIENLPAEFGHATVPELCHFLGHDNAMKPSMSVGENLEFWQSFSGQPHLAVDEALDMVGLGGLDRVPFGHLSTGQRRRSSIARLLVSWRPVWLLDEPTSGLDSRSERQFKELMEAHLEEDGIIIAATHLPVDLPNSRTLELGAIAA